MPALVKGLCNSHWTRELQGEVVKRVSKGDDKAFLASEQVVHTASS